MVTDEVFPVLRRQFLSFTDSSVWKEIQTSIYTIVKYGEWNVSAVTLVMVLWVSKHIIVLYLEVIFLLCPESPFICSN